MKNIAKINVIIFIYLSGGSMKKCIFCNIDKDKIYNKVLGETDNFIVLPSLGSLVEGYILIVSKHHLYNMGELADSEKDEYMELLNKYRYIFNKIYGKYPIIFEHGMSRLDIENGASSVVHAHTHIVNFNFNNEDDITKELNFEEIEEINNIDSNKNYIFYISHSDKKYITYNSEKKSQLMRILIAKELGFIDKYNWKEEPFTNNIIKTIEKLNK